MRAEPGRDGVVAQKYGADAIPQTVIIDRDGKIARLYVGAGPKFDETLRQALEQVGLLDEAYFMYAEEVDWFYRARRAGQPAALLLGNKAVGGNATVTLAHTATRDLPSVTREAEILVVAAGRPNTITADMVRPGAVVIDVGTNRVVAPERKSGFRLVGDVDFEAVKEVAAAITPVPGGVGPMTIAMLMANTIEGCRRSVGAVKVA